MIARHTKSTFSSLLMMSLAISLLAVLAGCGATVSSEQPNSTAAGGKQAANGKKQPAKAAEQPPETRHPFPHRTSSADFPPDMTWINTAGPLRKKDLKGKFVLLDFWTYCCINCMHVLPELKKLERAYPNQLVVIGVHSAKFTGEKDIQNISEAVLRHEIEHPVVNDLDHRIWDLYRVQSWPSIRLIDPEGYLVAGGSSEFRFEDLDAFLKKVMPYYRQQGLLDETPIHFDLLAHKQKDTPLRFPGKLLADGPGGRLFIADSNHNRIVIAGLDGALIETIGSSAAGRQDGSYTTAQLDHPQGMAIRGDTLYVADTENHLLRKVDLKKKQVSTIAGTGVQGRNAWPGTENLGPLGKLPERFVGRPSKTALNSPWALWIHKNALYIAMAGPHQIWKMPLDESEIGPYAGNGREDIVDGPLLPRRPFQPGASSFAQPSGLASDGVWLYVADSEGSSIRAVPFDGRQQVKTVVGTSGLPGGRLFMFGDRDGIGRLELIDKSASGRIDYRGRVEQVQGVLLQHALGVVYHDGLLYVADTYNNKIKQVDPKTGSTKTIAGTTKPGSDDAAGTLDEPAGIAYARGKLYVADTNNHLIRTIDLGHGNKMSTLRIKGLAAPAAPKAILPSYQGAKQRTLPAASVKPSGGKIKLVVKLALPPGWKINPLAPSMYHVEAAGPSGPIDRAALGKSVRLKTPAAEFSITLPAQGPGQDTLKVSHTYYYCQQSGAGLCKRGCVVWTVPLNISEEAKERVVVLEHRVEQ